MIFFVSDYVVSNNLQIIVQDLLLLISNIDEETEVKVIYSGSHNEEWLFRDTNSSQPNFFFFFFFFLPFLWLLPRHMEVPGPGVESEL